MAIKFVNGDGFLSLIDDVVMVDTSSNSVALTLPDFLLTGKQFKIKDTQGTASSNNITLVPQSGAKVDGQNTFVVQTNYQSVIVHCDGTNWYVI